MKLFLSALALAVAAALPLAAQAMIQHHRQALQMAKLARRHSATLAVQKLAASIGAAQPPEIMTMSGWLADWGEEVPSGRMTGMGHELPSGHSAPGMTSEHHTGAVTMAETEVSKGRNQQAVALARRVRVGQTAEVATMRRLLGS